jgi:N6-adenosine-specific RNA methylase IME4
MIGEWRERVQAETERVTINLLRAGGRRAAHEPPPWPAGLFRLLYVDPPWEYEHIVTESRAIANQYPTMTLEAICELKPPAAPDAVLFLWTTSPKLAEALAVLKAWDFSYRTCAVWDKEIVGMGYYFRQQHELLLVGARGAAPVPEPSHRPASVFRVRRGRHSAKPDHVYELLEAMYPTLTEQDRVELFARQPRPGWTAWGNEPVKAAAS